MERQDAGRDRARRLLGEIEGDLLALLSRAPEYGACGIDVTFHRGEIVRMVERREATRQIGAGSGR